MGAFPARAGLDMVLQAILDDCISLNNRGCITTWHNMSQHGSASAWSLFSLSPLQLHWVTLQVLSSAGAHLVTHKKVR